MLSRNSGRQNWSILEEPIGTVVGIISSMMWLNNSVGRVKMGRRALMAYWSEAVTFMASCSRDRSYRFIEMSEVVSEVRGLP